MEANGIVLSPDPRLRQVVRRHRGDRPGNRSACREDEEDDVRERRLRPGCPQIGGAHSSSSLSTATTATRTTTTRTCSSTLSLLSRATIWCPFSEGCLSIPGISCEIERPDHVVVEAYDLDANLIRYEATGVCSACAYSTRIDACTVHTMFERLKPMQRIKAVKKITRTPWPAALDRARRSKSHRPLPPQGLGFAPCSNSPARTKSTLSALRLVWNCAWSNKPCGGRDCVFVLLFARVPSDQGWASSLIVFVERELLLLRLFLWFWIYLFC